MDREGMDTKLPEGKQDVRRNLALDELDRNALVRELAQEPQEVLEVAGKAVDGEDVAPWWASGWP